MATEQVAPFDPRVPLLLLLSATTGLVDAASVLGLNKVFTANMTGNIVFVGFAAAGTPGFPPVPFVTAIAAFMIGAYSLGASVVGMWVARSGSIEAGGLTRTYRLYVLRGLPRQAPLVVVMHGSGEDVVQVRVETGYGAIDCPTSMASRWSTLTRTRSKQRGRRRRIPDRWRTS